MTHIDIFYHCSGISWSTTAKIVSHIGRCGFRAHSEVHPDVKDNETPEEKGGWQRDKDFTGIL